MVDLKLNHTAVIKKPKGKFTRHEVRCRKNYTNAKGETVGCGRMLYKAYFPVGTYLELKCPKCGKTHVVDIREVKDAN